GAGVSVAPSTQPICNRADRIPALATPIAAPACHIASELVQACCAHPPSQSLRQDQRRQCLCRPYKRGHCAPSCRTSTNSDCLAATRPCPPPAPVPGNELADPLDRLALRVVEQVCIARGGGRAGVTEERTDQGQAGPLVDRQRGERMPQVVDAQA